MIDRLKSICKFKEEQVADILVPKRASTTANIKELQIYQLSKEYLRKQITETCRYTTKQEKTMQSSELESGLPDEAEQECIVFFLLGMF